MVALGVGARSWFGERDAFFAWDCLPKYDTNFKEIVEDIAEVITP